MPKPSVFIIELLTFNVIVSLNPTIDSILEVISPFIVTSPVIPLVSINPFETPPFNLPVTETVPDPMLAAALLPTNVVDIFS